MFSSARLPFPAATHRYGNMQGLSVAKGGMTVFSVALVLSVIALFAQQNTPNRQVQQNVLVSTERPSVRIQLPTKARYLGSDRWVLYGVADCEIHVWVEAEPDKVVNRLYWVQFEAYIPSKPEARYNYPFTRTTQMGGLDFDVRARFGAHTRPKPDSDADHVWRMIDAAGYKAPQDMMNVRFVHLADKEKRSELMMIYAEDLKPTGLTSIDLEVGGKGSDRWAALEQALIERGAKKLLLSKLSAQ